MSGRLEDVLDIGLERNSGVVGGNKRLLKLEGLA
jgi:hypothetical protein